jgi:hypothetical protein
LTAQLAAVMVEVVGVLAVVADLKVETLLKDVIIEEAR